MDNLKLYAKSKVEQEWLWITVQIFSGDTVMQFVLWVLSEKNWNGFKAAYDCLSLQ